ncbi:MAG: flagellar export chaperone FlgN [Lutisporaceae bacterium]
MDMQLIKELNNITEQKLKFFREILDITVLQKEDIKNNKAENIETLVQKKQQVIDTIDKLDKSFLTGYRQLKDELKIGKPDKIDTDKYPELKTLKHCVEEIIDLAGAIMELENSNREKLNKIFDEVKNELKQINTGKRSLKAYEIPFTQKDGIYIDKKK